MAEPLKVERHTRTSRIALPVAAVVIVAAATIPAWGSSAIMKQAVTLATRARLQRSEARARRAGGS